MCVMMNHQLHHHLVPLLVISPDDRTQQEDAKESTSHKSEWQSGTRFHPLLINVTEYPFNNYFWSQHSILYVAICCPVVYAKYWTCLPTNINLKLAACTVTTNRSIQECTFFCNFIFLYCSIYTCDCII